MFGTVVDWHGSIVRELDTLVPSLDAAEFARAWREEYAPSMQRVMSGELGWVKLDHLHRMNLDKVLSDFGVDSLSEEQVAHLNLVWHRLQPWPDTVEGLVRLRKRFTLCTLSNGNLGLLANMAKNAGLPWDCILSAEVFNAYKPSPDTYLGVADVFDIDPGEVMLVAAHQSDLDAARACGLQTAYIERPEEFGADRIKDVSPQPDNTLHASDFIELARQLEC